MTPPVSDMVIDFFSDARNVATVPDARAPLGEIVRKIRAGGPQKFGTQMIVESYPELMEKLAHPRIRQIWGDRFNASDLGLTLTVPVFMARGFGADEKAQRSKLLGETTRTDLHCEPIGNVVVQLEGEKRWTLVSPEHSHLLRPTVAPDGRAYFFSMLDPVNPSSLMHVPRYEVTTRPGDVLWVPPWTWHRVEYLEGVTALTASLFHFRPGEFVRNNPTFAGLILPNLFKELLGVKTT